MFQYKKSFVVMAISFMTLTITAHAATAQSSFEKVLTQDLGINYSQIKEATSEIKKKKLAIELADEEIASILSYTLGASNEINSALRKKDVKKLQSLNVVIQKMKLALDVIPSYKGLVYRGTRLPASVLKDYTVGSVVTDRAFVSASLVGYNNGPHKMHILSKSGKIISPLSANPNEIEVLFRPDSKFKVVKVSANVDRSLLFHMEEQ